MSMLNIIDSVAVNVILLLIIVISTLCCIGIHIGNRMVRSIRMKKLKSLREWYIKDGRKLTTPNLIEYMKPPELKHDSGICSQGSYCDLYCIQWCIPEEFTKGWLVAKGYDPSTLQSLSKVWDDLIDDYFYGNWIDKL